MNKIIAGADIGGTHVTACLTDISQGNILPESVARISIDPSESAEAVIANWASVIKQSHVNVQRDVEYLGIAMPGPFDYEKGISYIKGLHKYESLYGLPVKKMLADALKIPEQNIRMMNDASAFLLGEMNQGAGKNVTNLSGITLGTGLGSAAFFDDNFEEGDLYKMPFSDGQAEDFISARWFINEYFKLTGRKVKGVKEIAEAAAQQQPAKQLFETFSDNLAKILAERYAAQNPEVIVVGGNIANAWTLFAPDTQEKMKQLNITSVLAKAQLGENAALTGAAYLWK